MKSIVLTILGCCLLLLVSAQTYYVQLSTVKGNITLRLYDETPKHRDNFLNAIKTGLFKDNSFNRVIGDFVSQAGELDETILNREKLHPGKPLQRVSAEIKPNLYHHKGALGAGRNDNPEKSSYLNQFYLVQGKKQTDADLDKIELKKGLRFSSEQREAYKSKGGTPKLDGDYTIFGEIVGGLDVAEAINKVPTNSDDLPLIPIKFSIRILTKKEISLKQF